MPDCTIEKVAFSPLKRRAVVVAFEGGDVSSDGGVLLLRKLERRLGQLEAVARVLADPRDPERVTHAMSDLLKQRVFGLCLGYEDLNDHARLRLDPLMQTACERDTALASAPTLCRLENRATRSRPTISPRSRVPRASISKRSGAAMRWGTPCTSGRRGRGRRGVRYNRSDADWTA